jgi:DNA-directed RNA polymerase subunit RPC12/RpoP
MTEWEYVCAGCGRRRPAEELVEMAEGIYQCDDCFERLSLDHLIDERRPAADDGPTMPLGDPGEAGGPPGAGRGSAA